MVEGAICLKINNDHVVEISFEMDSRNVLEVVQRVQTALIRAHKIDKNHWYGKRSKDLRYSETNDIT